MHILWINNRPFIDNPQWRRDPQGIYNALLHGGARDITGYGAQQDLYGFRDRGGYYGQSPYTMQERYGYDGGARMGMYPNMNGYNRRPTTWEEEMIERREMQAERERQMYDTYAGRGYPAHYGTGRVYPPYDPYRAREFEEQEDYPPSRGHSIPPNQTSQVPREQDSYPMRGRQVEVPPAGSASRVYEAQQRPHTHGVRVPNDGNGDVRVPE